MQRYMYDKISYDTQLVLFGQYLISQGQGLVNSLGQMS